jgi:hypothetical protein
MKAIEVLMAQALYQLLHLPKVWQNEDGHGIPYKVLYQHPAGQTLILVQVKFTQAVDHGHNIYLAWIQVELSFQNMIIINFNVLDSWGVGRGNQQVVGSKFS